MPDGADCATLTVPLDYSAPTGEMTHIALMRLKASGKRTGAVLFNPGGPGGSGIEFFENGVAQEINRFTPDLSTNFDLIGFDPRGVGLSDPIACVDGAYYERTAYLDDTPDTPEKQAALDAAKKEFDDACTAKYGTKLSLYSTVNTAKDMDVIREALGDSKLSYIGVSYGTFLGAVYANLFPTRVRAFVLDGAFDPTKDDPFTANETQLVGFEKAFGNWAADCQGNAACPFHATDVGARWDALVKKYNDTPVAAADGRMANDMVVRTATLASLYSREVWPTLDQALANAEAGKPDLLFTLADNIEGRNAKDDWTNINQANEVIDCASGLDPALPPDPQSAIAKLQAEAPRFAANVTIDTLTPPCDKIGIVNPPAAAITAYTGSGPILVVGGQHDPATPFRWATQMVTDFGGAASAGGTANVTLVTFTGEGHSTFLTSTCTTNIMAELISTAKQAAGGTVCAPDKPLTAPDYYASLPAVASVKTFDITAFKAFLGLDPTQYFSTGAVTDLDAAKVGAAYATAWSSAGLKDAGVPAAPTAEGFYRTEFIRSKDRAQILVIAVSAADLGKEPALAPLVAAMGASKTLVIQIVFPS